MFANLSWTLGRKLLRLGLRLMGEEPVQVVMFSSPQWTSRMLAEWAVEMGALAQASPASPSNLVIHVPQESWKEYDVLLTAKHAEHQQVAPARVGDTQDNPVAILPFPRVTTPLQIYSDVYDPTHHIGDGTMCDADGNTTHPSERV